MNRKFSLTAMRSIKMESLPELEQLILKGKRKKPVIRTENFFTEPVNIIAELKKGSPSRGSINSSAAVSEKAAAYSAGGASAISILTESRFFGGSLSDLKEASDCSELPLLCKDFIYHDLQIDAAYASGADMVLLIAGALNDTELEGLYSRTLELGMTPLVEIHSREETGRALRLNPDYILVNMRNLETLKIDYKTGTETLRNLPDSVRAISASGINTPDDIRMIKKKTGVSVFLVGTSLMQSIDPARSIRELKDVY